MGKSASFDVLGTCFHFQPIIDLIGTRFKQHLGTIDPCTLFHLWFYSAQRDFTYLSLSSSYTPIAQVLRHTFRRTCAVVDFPDPEKNITDDDIQALMQEVLKLPARPGLKKCFDGLREAGWDVYGVTNGGKQASLKYYHLADIALDDNHLISCDDIKAAKPDMRVYENAKKFLAQADCEPEKRWFVAAHEWDLIQARNAGFKTAWLSYEERLPQKEIFGEFDIYADSMEELLEKMKAAEK